MSDIPKSKRAYSNLEAHHKALNNMAVIYVALIVKGKRTYDSVPDLIKPQVKEMLIDLELAELVTE